MIETGFDRRVKIQQIIQNQLPEFLLSESPKSIDFLKQYYISQEYQGGPVDVVENLDQYLKVDNLSKEVINGRTTLITSIDQTSNTIVVDSTKGFPNQYGLLKIDDEIITYTGITTNSFTGCIRGFSGITTYHQVNNPEELEFSTSSAGIHTSGIEVKNLSSLFLQEFYNKIKYTFVPGLENTSLTSNLDISNFIKEAKSLYQSKGTEESYKILFRVLYDEDVSVVDLERFLSKPSSAKFSRREVLIVESISGDPLKLVGQTIRRTIDTRTQGSVSEVEIISRNNKTYYKVSLFVGYSDEERGEGNFSITGNSKVLESVSVGSSIISVDSTIGFAQTGILISDSNLITYTNKSVNQFFGCSGINNFIPIASNIRSNDTAFGYEDGDLSKKVEIRITGVLSEFIPLGTISLVDEGQFIGVKNLGESIKNPQNNKTFKQIFANSWIYNTSSRYQVENISGSTFTLLSTIDKSSLKVGDIVDVLVRGTQTVVASNARVSVINAATKQVILNELGSFIPSISLEYDIRRKIRKASSSGVTLEYGNDSLISDVQNVYTDNSNEYGYVASNSLPKYNITKNIFESTISEANGIRLQDLNTTTLKYSIISFPSNVPFTTGDEVVYLPEKITMPGLISGNSYYVQVLPFPNQIRLYTSRSFIGSSEYIEFGDLPSGSGYHRFILSKHKSLIVSPQKLLRKFPLQRNFSTGNAEETIPGGVGLLINGVEIISAKTNDKVNYGPLTEIKVINSGNGYDVLNPPKIEIESPQIGFTTALVQPVVSGSIDSILIDPQEFDIDTVISATVTGGNGNGSILRPIISKRFREVEFDARENNFGGGLDTTDETITFLSDHNFINGQVVIYSNNGNVSLGIGTFGPPDNIFNRVGNKTLVSGSEYYVQIVNPKTVKLYQTFDNYFVGVNTVGFTTENAGGIHKFRTLEKNTLRDIKVINSGNGYENRKLIVKTSGISTETDSIIFKNHNFNDGDIINYETTGTAISGLSTSNSYYILKINNDSFKLANAGIGNSISSNYERRNYVKLSSTGSGYHIFKYPDIQVLVNVSFGSSVVGVITATPVIKGKIIDAYLYENGSGYGSEIINFDKKPIISIKNGKNAEVSPIIKNGRIIDVQVLSGGTEYYSVPNLEIIGNGFGAILRPIISNQKLIDVIVINSGTNYDQNTTKINVIASGSGSSIEASIRSLTLNEQFRNNDEVLVESLDNLEYSIVGYSTNIFTSEFNDTGAQHSPIIGWAYDGNPIYGPYGYSNPEDTSSSVRLIRSGYTLDSSRIENRPLSFSNGFFIDDYIFNDLGDLDIHNGRFCKTPEFPNGTYAYFVGVATDIVTNTLKPTYPYFIGNSYRSKVEKDNFLLNQSFNFNNSNLIRNTFPYKLGDRYADNDFIVESNEIINQQTKVESVTKGSVTDVLILNAGDGYRVGENAIFDNTGTNGNGLSLQISEVKGKEITKLSTSIETYNDSVFVWKDKETVEVYTNPYHTVRDNEYITVSGLTTSISRLNGIHQVGVTPSSLLLLNDIGAVISPGTVEDIYVSTIPSLVSVGSTLTIGIGGSETVRVLNIFNEGSILRIRRSDSGIAHTSSTVINILPNKIEIPIRTSYFDSKVRDIIYFNPKESIGIGTISGISSSVTYTVGQTSKNISVLSQSIYLPNHPFKTGQQVSFVKKGGTSSIICSPDEGNTTINLPGASNSDLVFVINKSKDYIGLTTQVGLTTNTQGLYFLTNGSDNYEYYIAGLSTQITGKVKKINTTVSVSTSHGLNIGDIVSLKVEPNIESGIGNSTSVKLVYNSVHDKLLVNPIGFTSTAINTGNSQITIDASYLNTGDKIFYSSTDIVASGLETGTYFVYKIDDNTIKLSETLSDTNLKYPNTVTILGFGGNGHNISLVNPQISVVKNCDLVFDVSDSSLVGKKLKIFYDKDFNNEFIGVGNTSIFNISGLGTVGVTSTAQFKLKYSNNIPSKLYYALETSGFISTSDKEVRYDSEISFIDSAYNGSYIISGIGTTTFNVALGRSPENNDLLPSQCDTLEYFTTSKNTTGGISKLKTIFAGYNYKKSPQFVGFSSSFGENANIVVSSTEIGKINQTRILNYGFDYSSDKTLKPESAVSPIVYLDNSNTITSVEIIDGGKNYSSPPSLVIVDPDTGTLVNDNSLSCTLSGTSIGSVNIIVQPFGLGSSKQRIVAINNNNGVSISSITSSPTGVVTCALSTPILGFSTNIFSVGDEIFVEGIEKDSSTGQGFNSSDYGYRFFKVSAYFNTNPAIVEFNLTGIATNAGLAKTNQGYASIIAKKDYPIFETTQEFALFKIEEAVLTDRGSGFIERDLYISESTRNYIKVTGSYSLEIGEKIKGKNSAVVAIVQNIVDNAGYFEVSYSSRQDYGWITDTGKLGESYQVTSDNDYYQNLSYSIRSKIQYEDLINPVNRLLHTSGLKNFSDTQVIGRFPPEGQKVSYASTTNDTIVLDISEEKRVDAINNFDLTIDINTVDNKTKSKFLKFKNKKLTDYIKCLSNRVLVMDDISPRFSNKETGTETFVDIDTFEDTYSKYLIQIINPNNKDRQISEIVVLNDETNAYVLEKAFITNTTLPLGQIIGKSDSESQVLRFIPEDAFDTDYDIKILKNIFNSSVNGIGTQSVGFINLIGLNKVVGIGSTEILITANANVTKSLYASLQILNVVTNKMNYVELFIDHDGTTTYHADFFFDSTGIEGNSSNYMGTFDSSIQSETLSVTYHNNENNDVLIRSSIVGFGTTAVGVGTYRFLSSGQPEGTEKSARYQSNYTVSSGSTSIIGINTSDTSALKSIVRVSYGETSAIHQVLMIQDQIDVHTIQYPFLSIGSTSGIGTFGGEIIGSDAYLNFYPDPSLGNNIQIQSFNEVIYFENDYNNISEQLDYGTATALLQLNAYDAINGTRSNRLNFDARYEGNSIFVKMFNPSNSSILDPETGTFSIANHFFSTGEELYYEPGSTFIGVGATGVGIGLTENYVGVVTSILPPVVYAININQSQFRLSTKREYANAGIAVTFTSFGSGNAHTLEMAKKLEKSIISLNGVVQKPLTFVPISYSLENNFGQVGSATSYFSSSGISSITPKDILKVNDEYMGVISVGLGTTNSGPITGLGTFPLIQVTRGFVGSSATTHLDGSNISIYRGAYNISKNKIWFTEAPKGNPIQIRDRSNILFPKTTFNGRVYLRNDYSTNVIYDDISEQFTGIGQTYTLTVQGINTVGIETGNGILFLNDIFQTPTTSNNEGNNFNVGGSVGISSVVFTGITSTNGQIVVSSSDINQNQLPRGGAIISLGSTSGAGFAPLVAAGVTAVVGAGGSIVSVGLGTLDIFGSGYRDPVSIAVTDSNHTGTAANISAIVGAGGTLSFVINDGGSGYNTSTVQIDVSQPSYDNLPVVGTFRAGIGSTTETGFNLLITLDVGPISTTGIGSTLFEVSSFKISRSGYGFKVGDKFKPVGLVTSAGLSSPLEDFELTVLDVFTDSFAFWQFGELDYIDSIKNLQNGSRTRFPLFYNGQLLSFEIDPSDTTSASIDLNAVLLIFINGVIQQPGSAYSFVGGSSFVFSNPPRSEDNISIFFYRGTRGSDSFDVNINESIKIGDSVQVFSNNDYSETITQNFRDITNILGSDTIETNLYTEQGIDETFFKPTTWIKQKKDKIINGDIVSKERDSLESQIYPTSKIIKDLSVGDTEIFVDDSNFFNYEENNYSIVINSVSGLIVQAIDPVSAAITATVSADGTISSLNINDGGSGYNGSETIKISAPRSIGVGIGTTALASITIINGSVSSANIINEGLGYLTENPPQILVSYPDIKIEEVTNISVIQGFSGIITGIGTTTGTSGNTLGLKFYIQGPNGFVGLNSGYPILIKDTNVGTGLTSLSDSGPGVVGIGTTNLDNIYFISKISVFGDNAEIDTNIKNDSNISGILTSGTVSSPIGKYSWGKLSNLSRSASPIAIGVSGLTIDSGLTTFPTIQRRGFGLRDTGAIRKQSNV